MINFQLYSDNTDVSFWSNIIFNDESWNMNNLYGTGYGHTGVSDGQAQQYQSRTVCNGVVYLNAGDFFKVQVGGVTSAFPLPTGYGRLSVVKL